MATPNPRRAGKIPPNATKAAPAPEEKLSDWLVKVPLYLQMLFVGMVVLAMTPLTHNLDDIKMMFFLVFGGAMAVVGLASIMFGLAPLPHRPMVIGLASYLFVMALSTTLSEFSWVGWRETVFMFAGYGFFLGGLAIGARWETTRTFALFLVVMLFATNLFGFFQYDLLGNGNALIARLYDMLYGVNPTMASRSALQTLLYTFSTAAQGSLMSTALNRDFYAAFCLLYFPTAVSLALISRRRAVWGMGIATAVFSLASIFLCKSKGEYAFAVASILLFITLFALAIRKLDIPWGYVWAWSGGVLLLILTFALVNLSAFQQQLKSASTSFASRRIIFRGAVELFKEFPILGSGPGTYVIYFPRFRNPNYFNHEISNVTERAHNYVLDILCETGLVGGATFGLFALSLAFLAFRAVFRAQDQRLRLLIIAALCGLLGMYGSNMTSTSGRWPIGAVGLWTFMGLLAGYVRQSEGWRPVTDKSGNIIPWTIGGLNLDNTTDFWGRIARTQPKRIRDLVLGVSLLGFLFAARQGVNYWRTARAYNDGMLDFERVNTLFQREANDPNTPPDLKAKIASYLNISGANFARAIEIDPYHLSTYYKWGSVENMLANLEMDRHEEHLLKAQILYLRLSELSPDYAEIHYNFGIVYYRLASLRNKQIASILREAGVAAQGDSEEEIQKVNMPEATKKKALELVRQRDQFKKESRAYFERMQAMSNKSDVFLNLADTYYRSGEYERSREIFKRALEIYPRNMSFAKGYYGSALRLNDAAGQVAGLRAQWEVSPAERGVLYQALRLAMENNLDEAFKGLMQIALERNPVDPVLYELSAQEAEKRGSKEQVADAANKYVKLVSNEGMAEIMRGMISVKPEVIASGAKAAESLGDTARARACYAYLAGTSTTFAPEARAWLAAKPE